MIKIKDFFKKVYLRLCKFFNNDKRIIILLLVCVFLLGFAVGGYVESLDNSNNSSSKEFITTANSSVSSYNVRYIDNDYRITEDGFMFDLGLQSQVLLSTSSQSGYSTAIRNQTSSLPICFSVVNNSWDEYTGTLYDIKIGSIAHDIDNSYYLSRDLSLMDYRPDNFEYNEDFYISYDNIVTQFVNGSNLTLNSGIFTRFTNSSTAEQFGFNFPLSIGVLSNSNNCVFVPYGYTTYFYFNTNYYEKINSPTWEKPTSIVSYTISYEDFTGYHVGTNSEGNNTIYLPYFKVHSILFDNGLVYSFGMPYLVKYRPSDYEVGLTNTVYIMRDGVNDSDYQLGYTNGYNNGLSDGKNVAVETLTPFYFIGASISSFLAIRLFGDVSLGVVISIIFGVLLLGVIIKTFLGG